MLLSTSEQRWQLPAPVSIDPELRRLGLPDPLLALLLRTCCVAGDRVAWPAPTYSLYRVLADLAGLVAIEVAADAGHAVPPGVLAADARVNFLCTPNSPSGKPLPLDAIAAFARAARGLVVVDEAYVDFGGASALSILQDHPNMVVTRSFSKSFSLAGLRLGLLFGHEDFVAELEKGKDSYNVSRLAAAAGVAALEDIDWMRANVAKVCATRQRVADELRRRGFAPAESSANFLWVDCKAQGGGRPVYERLRQGSVLVRYFSGLPDGFRVTIGTDAEMDRFLAVLDGR